MSKPALDKDDSNLISHHCKYEAKYFLKKIKGKKVILNLF